MNNNTKGILIAILTIVVVVGVGLISLPKATTQGAVISSTMVGMPIVVVFAFALIMTILAFYYVLKKDDIQDRHQES